jgi:hypothetical protein
MPCPKCKAKLKGPDGLVGRTVKCPGCGTPVTITADALVPPPAASAPAAPPAAPKPPPPPPPPAKIESKPEPGFIPNMSLDDDDEPAAAPKAAPPTAPKGATELPLGKTAADLVPGTLDDLDDIGFKDDPAPPPPPPAPKKPAAAAPPTPPKPTPVKKPEPPPKKAAAPAKKAAAPAKKKAAPVKKPADGLPNMELDDDVVDAEVDEDDDVVEAEVEDDGDVVEAQIEEDGDVVEAQLEDKEEGIVEAQLEEDGDVVEAQLEEEMWVDPVEEEGEVLEAVEDDVPVLETADDGEELEVVESGGPRVSFRLMTLPRLHVRSQSGLFAMTNAYDLVNPKNQKKIGEAVERPETSAQVLSLFVSKNLTATKIEVMEGRNDLVMTVRRSAYFMTAKAEIFDADDEKLGSFEIRPFSALFGKPLWISDHKDRQIIKLEMKLFSGYRYFKNKKGTVLAQWVHETTYEKKLIKFKLAPRGNSFYIVWKDIPEDRPEYRLLILGASLGLDLFQTADNRGPRLGRR